MVFVIEIPCDNAERVGKFYSEVFGWTITVYGSYHMFESNDPTYKVSGNFTVDKNRFTFVAFHLHVENVQQHLEKIKAAGGSIVKEKFEMDNIGHFGHFKDSEGNVMSLYSKSG